jgi:hypothetical protein
MRFYNVKNKLIDFSTECAVFIRRVHVELNGEKKRQQCRIIARIVPGKGKGKVQPRTGHEDQEEE